MTNSSPSPLSYGLPQSEEVVEQAQNLLAQRPCVCGAYPHLEWAQCPGRPEWGWDYCG